MRLKLTHKVFANLQYSKEFNAYALDWYIYLWGIEFILQAIPLSDRVICGVTSKYSFIHCEVLYSNGFTLKKIMGGWSVLAIFLGIILMVIRGLGGI